MDIKQILTANGIDSDKVDMIANAIKSDIHTDFIPKAQYQKKVNMIGNLQEKINDYEAKQNSPNEFKQKYDDLLNEYESYKGEIETSKVNNQKLQLLKNNFKKDGIEKDNLIDLLCKGINLNEIEIEENNIKGWDELSVKYKDNYKDFYSTESTQGGTEPSKPPIVNHTALTRESIKNMTKDEINANWEEVSKALMNQ